MGYLISKEWHLSKTQYWVALIAKAEKYDHRLGAFADSAEELTNQFWPRQSQSGWFDEQPVDFEDLRGESKNFSY